MEKVLSAAEHLSSLLRDVDVAVAKRVGQQYLFYACDEAKMRTYLKVVVERFPARSQSTAAYYRRTWELWQDPSWAEGLDPREKAQAWMWATRLLTWSQGEPQYLGGRRGRGQVRQAPSLVHPPEPMTASIADAVRADATKRQATARQERRETAVLIEQVKGQTWRARTEQAEEFLCPNVPYKSRPGMRISVVIVREDGKIREVRSPRRV